MAYYQPRSVLSPAATPPCCINSRRLLGSTCPRDSIELVGSSERFISITLTGSLLGSRVRWLGLWPNPALTLLTAIPPHTGGYVCATTGKLHPCFLRFCGWNLVFTRVVFTWRWLSRLFNHSYIYAHRRRYGWWRGVLALRTRRTLSHRYEWCTSPLLLIGG